MENFAEKEYKAFELFDKQWALVTAGSMDHYNSCTVSWGSLGNIWSQAGKSLQTVTVYIHPARYTSEFLSSSDTFTVSFYPESCKKALGYMGSHSGRDGDKAAAAGLTPVEMGQGVTYKEANLTFLCKKLYQHQFSREDLAPEIQEYYASMPKVYPDFKGGWHPKHSWPDNPMKTPAVSSGWRRSSAPISRPISPWNMPTTAMSASAGASSPVPARAPMCRAPAGSRASAC